MLFTCYEGIIMIDSKGPGSWLSKLATICDGEKSKGVAFLDIANHHVFW